MAGFTYKSYSFVDKDPMIDQVRTIIQDSGITYKSLSEDSGVSVSTINNWLGGATKKPQAASMNAVLRALNHKLAIVPLASAEVIKFTPAPASATSIRHVIQINKYKKTKGSRRG
jgi:transcriptional regulator with XRE-family HTH domain